MKQQRPSQLCEKHQMTFHLLDFNPKCPPDQMYLCYTCYRNLIQMPETILFYEETPKLFSSIKKELTGLKEAQHQNNLLLLNELLTTVVELEKILGQLKNEINKSLDVIQINQQGIAELEDIEPETYFTIMEKLEKQEIEFVNSLKNFPNGLKQAGALMQNLKKNFFSLNTKITSQTPSLPKSLPGLGKQQYLNQWRDRIEKVETHMQTRYNYILRKLSKRTEQIDSNFEQIQTKFQESHQQFLQNLQNLTLEQLTEITEMQNKSDLFEQLPQNQYLDKWINKIEKRFRLSLCKLKDQDLQKKHTKMQIMSGVFNIKRSDNANYEKIPQKVLLHSHHCQAITLQKTLMLVACENNILFYDFQEGQLKFKSKLTQETDQISCLYLFKSENKFIVGGLSIGIWSKNDQQVWFCAQILISSQINQIVLNQEENLMISCSFDGHIEFWTNDKKWQLSQTIKDQNDQINCLSLNQSEDLLASCGILFKKWYASEKGSIMLYKKQKESWLYTTIIEYQESIHRICFIGSEFLIYQARGQSKINILQIFGTGKTQKEYGGIEGGKNDVSHFFPPIFNRKKSILIYKQGETLHNFKIKSDEFSKLTPTSTPNSTPTPTTTLPILTPQKIEFETQVIEGTLSNDGNYLIVWDHITKSFQVFEQH